MFSKNEEKTRRYKQLIRTIHLSKTTTVGVFSLAILFLILISIGTFKQIKSFVDSNSWVTHTYQVIQTANRALFQIMQIESQQRGFLITSNTDYLSDVQSIRNELEDNLDVLKVLTKDNVDQNVRVTKFIVIVNQRLQTLNQIVELKANSAIDAQKINDLLGRSKNLSNRVTDLGEEIVAVEQVLLQERKNTLLSSASSTNLIFIVGNLLSALFLISAFTVVLIELSSRRTMQENNKKIQLQLRKIIENSSDMIAAFDSNYRLVIFNEAYHREFKNIFGKQLEKNMFIDSILADTSGLQKKFAERWLFSIQNHNEVYSLEFQDHHRQLSFESNSSDILDEFNAVSGIVHSVRNITNRIIDHKKLQESHRQLETNMVELKKKNTQISHMVEMSDVMLACSSQTELCYVMSRFSQKLLPETKGYLYIMHPSRNFLESSTSWGEPFKQNATFSPEQCWAIRLGRVHHVGHERDELICEHIDPSAPKKGSLCIPLMAKNDIYGLLYIEAVHDESILLNENRLVINAFAELTALALANIRLRENLNYQSIRDPLTGLYNRRYLEDFLQKEIFQAERDRTQFAVLMLDLDHFKKINDTYGHDAGDIALKEFSKILSEDVRGGDISSRYGGEEFIIILHHIDSAAAKARAETIREAVSSISIKYGAHQVGAITVSIGVALFPTDSDSAEKLIEAADKALYQAKSKGRNQVVLYSDIQKLS